MCGTIHVIQIITTTIEKVSHTKLFYYAKNNLNNIYIFYTFISLEKKILIK